MSSWVGLLPQQRWQRLPNGSTETQLKDGRRLRCGPGAGAMLDALAQGLSETDLNLRFLSDPNCHKLWLMLSELALVETSTLPRRRRVQFEAGSAASVSPSPLITALRRTLPLLLLLNCAAALLLLPGLTEHLPRQGPLWLLTLLLVYLAHAGLHELAHAGCARVLGIRGRIQFFRQGFWQPRFEARAQTGLSHGARVAAIYAAGPLLDLGVQALALLALTQAFEPALAAAVWSVATVLALLNLSAHGTSDGNRLLGLQRLPASEKTVYRLVHGGCALLALLLLLRLAGTLLANPS